MRFEKNCPAGSRYGLFKKYVQFSFLFFCFILLFSSSEAKGYFQQQQITGKVVSSIGEPLSGASIRIQNRNVGTNTDAAGNFTIMANAGDVLVVSFVGYAAQQITVGDQANITITLQPSGATLEQVVVVGYGTQRKLDVTGAVSQVKGDEINRQPVVNPVSGLQGRVAGVQITNSGAPGASPQIRIRGVGTVYGNPNPLYVVDGVWFDDISFLNPADIENISILKDASSESIYGIRAANGVVLITTRRGKSGQATVNYTGFVGNQRVIKEVEMANANQYATLINELRAANGGDPLYNPADYGKGTDWYGQVLRNALITNHQVSVSGGAERTTYNFSLGYTKQQGLVEGNEFDRYTARLQNDFQVVKGVRLGYTITGAASNSDDIPGGIFHQLYTAAPVVPVYYADGSYGDPSDYGVSESVNFNPQATLDFFNQKSKNYRLTGNVFGELKFAQNFTFRTSIGGEFGQGEVSAYNPVYTATLKQRNTTSSLRIERAETRNWLLENTLTYDKRFADHNVRVLVGQSAQRYQFYKVIGSALNVPNTTSGDLYLRLGSQGGRNIIDEGDLSTVASYFGRVNYSFRNRYLLNASLRADGSSKFFGDERWGYFPSIGVGWVISEEGFMKNQDIFSTVKLRGSWGKIGNASVPSGLSVLRVTQDPYLTAFFGGQPNTGGSITTVVPPTTFWERGVGTDIGLEVSVLRNKLYFEADYYNRETEQAIFDIPILGSVGTNAGSIIGNQATFQNRGFEFTSTWRDNIGDDLSYTLSGNFSINENKVLSVATGANPIFGGGAAATGGALATRTIVGQPIGEFYGLQVAGIFQTDAAAAGSAQPNAKAGDFQYIDQNKDGIIDGKDRIAMGNPNPKYSYGFNTNWTFREFDLTLDFQGVAGVDIYNAALGLRFGSENFTKEFFENRWHGQGTSTTYPSANIGGGTNYLPNTFFVEDGSYFRIRTAQLGYTLPRTTTDRWNVKSLRVFVNAQNPFNFFKYRGFNPEVGTQPGQNPTNTGIDINVYPLSATYNFGVNLTF
jgi:TonB-linked SusC/RagA family outer membrane protein